MTLRHSIVGATAKLQTSVIGARWLKPEGIHLTLKFIGYIEETQIDPISDAVCQVITDQKPLVLKVEGIGVFPNLKRPRVIWVGLTGDIGRLMLIQKRIEESLSLLGFPVENRPFSPHLTVGRVPSPKKLADLTDRIRELEGITFDSFTVNELVLYQSTLRPTGAIYTPLRHLPFIG